MTAERRANGAAPDRGNRRVPDGQGIRAPSSPLPVGDLARGSNYLCTGPPMTGKSGVLAGVLGDGVEAGEGAVVVSTESDARAVLASDERLSRASEADNPPVEVVDCVTEFAGGSTADAGDVARYVSSPDDLTGIGVEFNRIVERFDAQGIGRVRVLVDSLTPLFVYRDAGDVFRFLQVLTGRIAALGGVGFAVSHSGVAASDEIERVRSLFDGTVEFREGGEGDVEVRVRSPDATDAEWVTLAGSGAGTGVADVVAGGGNGAADDDGPTVLAGTGSNGDGTRRHGDDDGLDAALSGGIDSLSAAVDAVTAAGRTLTVCNYGGDPDTLADLRAHFERLNVAVREASLSTDTPRDVALLHRDGQHVASAPVEDLASALAVGETAREAPAEVAAPELLEIARQGSSAAHRVWRRRLVRTSRLVETMAWNAGTGTVHAGFQDLSRLTDSDATSRVYDRIADRGVETHVYGRPDATVDDRFVVHAGESEEIARTWFVVFTDAPTPTRAAALVARQEGDAYDGFWTYRPDTAVAVRDYLDATYGTADAV